MPAKDSIESLLQILVNTPETEKGSVIYSVVKSLREACSLFKKSSLEYQEASKRVQEILDSILSETIQEEEEWEDEFSESSEEKIASANNSSHSTSPSTDTYEEDEEIEFPSSSSAPSSASFNPATLGTPKSSNRTVMVKPSVTKTAPPPQPPVEAPVVSSPISKLIQGWNTSVGNWLKLPDADPQNSETIIKLVQNVATNRNNILSNNFDDQPNILKKADRFWDDLVKLLTENSYKVFPASFNDTQNPTGRIIYTCRNRVTTPETELLCPGLLQNDNLIKEPIFVISYAPETDFPAGVSHAGLPSHWRGVFGELDVLQEQLKLQTHAYSAMEGLNKNKVEGLEESRDNLLGELGRRIEVLENTIQKDPDSIYRVATDYWRVEEFFWSIYHDDDRPSGCSVFDRLRNRLQSWRPTLRRLFKFHIRDFNCGTDSLASVNKFIGNIIIATKPGTNPGMVVRELRPAIMVPIQGTNRLLKGRVIST